MAPTLPRTGPARPARRAAVLGTLLVLATPVVAHAAATTYDDPQRDVRVHRALPRSTPAGTASSIDVDKMTIARDRRNVTVRVWIKDVLPARTSSADVFQGVEIRTAFRTPRSSAGTVHYATKTNRPAGGTLLEDSCAATRSSSSVSGDHVTFVIPRGCFGGAAVATFHATGVLSDNGYHHQANTRFRTDRVAGQHRV